MKQLFTILFCCAALTALGANPVSPDKRLTARENGSGIKLSYRGRPALDIATLGFLGVEKPAQSHLRFVRHVTADYDMLSGKRLHCSNEANEYACDIADGVRLVLRLYNDGVAFRYELSDRACTTLLNNGAQGNGAQPHDGDAWQQELTTYTIPEGTRRWIQQWTDAYEAFFPLTTSYRTKPERSFSGVWKSDDGYNIRWGYPALVEAPLSSPQPRGSADPHPLNLPEGKTSPVPSEGGESYPAANDGVYVLITEANIERGQSASCLYNNGEQYRVVPDRNDNRPTAAWHTPWRVAIIGTLADVVQSTLVTDVSEPCRLNDTSWIKPGVVSWIYWAHNHGSNDYNIICQYVDMAVALHLPYVLIDAEWDTMGDNQQTGEGREAGGKTIEDAVAYALQRGVKPLIWYNSSVGWVDGAPTPKYRLNKADDREREFAWCERLGVAGVKIDFFSGDDLMNMDYCLDLLESAARHHLLVNFHGATIPRGWQRTYPHLLSTEAVYGAEWYNNVPTFTSRAASHNATLPFTRNVVGPMDYTPCAFSDSQHPHITTHGHELALTVLFESALQHLADRPESFLAQPAEVQQFLGQLPTVWDETRYVAGYPGHSVVLARRSGLTWYVAGINGTDDELTIPLSDNTGHQPLAFLGQPSSIRLFADGNPWHLSQTALPYSVTLRPRGGFVMVVK